MKFWVFILWYLKFLLLIWNSIYRFQPLIFYLYLVVREITLLASYCFISKFIYEQKDNILAPLNSIIIIILCWRYFPKPQKTWLHKRIEISRFNCHFKLLKVHVLWLTSVKYGWEINHRFMWGNSKICFLQKNKRKMLFSIPN